jgi:type IV pilus assembly protein PilC
MPKFVYTIKKDGKKISDSIEASDRNAALRKLADNNIVITQLTAVSERKDKLRVSADDLLMFTQELASMIRAGISLKKALDILASDVDNPSMRQVIMEISSNLGEGCAISAVMARYPKIFPKIYVSMVKAGEASGDLDGILKRLADYISDMETLKQKVIAQLYYPSMILGFSFFVMSFLMFFGIPRIAEIYAGLDAELPAFTMFLINIGSFVDKFWAGIFFLMFTSAFFVIRWSNTPIGIRFWDTFKIKTKLIGPIFQKILISRFARSLSTLYSSGVPLLQCMELVGESIGNVVMEEAVASSIQNIGEGQSISSSLSRHHHLFTPMTLSMLSVGEETGSLSSILDELASFYEERVEISLKGLMSLLEPVVMIFLGIFVGILIIALALPFLTLFTKLS